MKSRLLSFRETQALLQQYHVPLPRQILVPQPEDVTEAAVSIGFPLVLKLVSSEATHKADAQLVHVNIQTTGELCLALESMLQRAEELPREGFLLQEMLSGGVETLVGTIRDAQFGQALVFGAGGTLVELLQDTSLRILPLNAWQVEQMINETRISRLLAGVRGKSAVDRAALVDCMLKLACLAQEQAARLVSLDLNPLIVLPHGVCAVDARIVVREEEL